MKNTLFTISLFLLFACKNHVLQGNEEIIASGQAPGITSDSTNKFHLVYGSGDSILYCYSSDHGKTFSTPALVSILPHLAASHTRGPQVAVTANGLILTACNDSGNIYSFIKNESAQWQPSGKVNDRDTVAKENLMALSADGLNVFAIWLDLRNGHNEIYGARSMDGGKSWSKNILVYASPDKTVCECCKPSVAVKGNEVYVMFRNWIAGNRDMYLIQSSDGGNIFGSAQKLGDGTWPLKGCPMDGGGFLIKGGIPQTVWNRKGKIYASVPGETEQEIGEGENCSIETINGKNIYAWVEDGEVVFRKPQGMKKVIGKGQLPVLKAVNNEHVLCLWENDKQIHKAIVEL